MCYGSYKTKKNNIQNVVHFVLHNNAEALQVNGPDVTILDELHNIYMFTFHIALDFFKQKIGYLYKLRANWIEMIVMVKNQLLYLRAPPMTMGHDPHFPDIEKYSHSVEQLKKNRKFKF